MSHIDITAVEVRQRSNTLDVRFKFHDLKEEMQSFSGLGWDMGYQARLRYCCTIRVHPEPADTRYELTYWNRCHGCGRSTIEIGGNYDPERDAITVSVPLDQTPIRAGDELSGCALWGPDGPRCGRNHSGCTSPGPMLGSRDCFRVLEKFTIR